MNKLSIFLFLLLACSCAPHYHVLKATTAQKVPSLNQIKMGCYPANKAFFIEARGVDSLCYRSKSLSKSYCDTVGIMGVDRGMLFKMSDRKFHRSLLNDTIHVKFRENGKWKEISYLKVSDAQLENKIITAM